MEKILIIDDNDSLRYTLTNVIEEAGFGTCAVENGEKGLEEIKKGTYQLVISDMKLPGMDGMMVLRESKKINPDLPVILLTAFGEIKNAVDAMKQGAADYLTKPFNNEDMIFTIRKALELKYLSQEVNLLRKRYDNAYKQDMIIGNNKKMREIFEQIKVVAPTNLTVLLEGESGTGKEVAANMIHRLSDRRDKPFIAIDCGAIPETLIESELFGHEKGAYTDARTQKEGKFELANGGTIFLDEITNLSDANQMKLLRAIQDKKITRLGGKKAIELDIRIITATNLNLSDAVNNEIFRADLFYRLNEFHISIPPLRERIEDIPVFADHIIKNSNGELNKNIENLSDTVMAKIKSYSWPGNIRELRNVIRRAVLLSTGNTIDSIYLPESNENSLAAGNNLLSFDNSTKQAERDVIIKALNMANGNKSKAAKILNMNERTMYRKIKSLGIQ
jgi:DNA-binding NtrC family response regulator